MMKDQKLDSHYPECSRCGQRMGPESELLETGDEGFVCEFCYAQMLYPDLKITCTEMIE